MGTSQNDQLAPLWLGKVTGRRERLFPEVASKRVHSPRRAIARSFPHQRKLCPHHVDLCVVCLGHGETWCDSGGQQEAQRQRRLQYARRRHAGYHHNTSFAIFDGSRMARVVVARCGMGSMLRG